ncbi:hypothetical protein [Sulfurimonas sp.]
MFLLFKDKSNIAQWGLELGHSDIKYIEIPDNLLEQLSVNFLRVFKQYLKQKQYSSFKQRKRKPNYKEIFLNNIIGMDFDTNKIYIKYEHHHNLIREFEEDIKIINIYASETTTQ